MSMTNVSKNQTIKRDNKFWTILDVISQSQGWHTIAYWSGIGRTWSETCLVVDVFAFLIVFGEQDVEAQL